jgi:hypothetical protein
MLNIFVKKNDSCYIFFNDLFSISGLCIKWCFSYSFFTSLCIYHIVISDCVNLKVRWRLPVAWCSSQVFRKPINSFMLMQVQHMYTCTFIHTHTSKWIGWEMFLSHMQYKMLEVNVDNWQCCYNSVYTPETLLVLWISMVLT